jgi:putative transposase
MSNHVHLIIEPTRPNTLSKIIQSITLSYIRFYHSKYKSLGHLWQGRFKTAIIQTDEYLLECIKYIELNPLRANIVARPGDYKWSSFRYHSFGEDEYKLLDPDPLYSSLANTDRGRQKAYKDFIALNQDKAVFDLIKKSISHDSILGSDGFINRLRKELALSKPRPRGRPRRKIINL